MPSLTEACGPRLGGRSEFLCSSFLNGHDPRSATYFHRKVSTFGQYSDLIDVGERE